jgi:hypothetical protein
MSGGFVTVSNGASDTLVVEFTGGSWFSNAALSSSVSFPDTITTTKTYYTGVDTPGVVISVKRNGVEIANTPDGTRTVNINDDKGLVFSVDPDPGDRLGAAEIAARYVGKAASLKALVATGTASVNFDEIAAGETGSKTFTLTGAATGDIVVINVPVLTTGLAFAGAAVTAANTVTVYAVNSSAAAIDQAAATFSYLWFDLT